MPRLTLASLCLVLVPSAAPAGSDDRLPALNHYKDGQKLVYSEGCQAALREFAEAVRLDPIFALAYYEAGLCQMTLKDYPAALKSFGDSRDAFQKVFELQTTDSAKAQLRLDQDIQELRQGLETARAAKTNNFTVMKIEDRIRELETQRKRGGSGTFEVPAEVSLGLGSAHLRMDQLDDAEREYLAAVKVRPKFGEAHNNLAVIYLKKGRVQEAEQEVTLAEKAGFTVPPGLKDAIKGARK
jgi:tetratricopeptide (TPR) repeat protein